MGTLCWDDSHQTLDYLSKESGKSENWHYLGKSSPIQDKLYLIIEEETIEQKFNRLTQKWKEDTAGVASPTKKILNLNYLTILTLREKAIPLILRELERESDDWFLLLKILTEQNPVKSEDVGSPKRVTEAWLRWGRENNYL
jgi:hypothetical protein